MKKRKIFIIVILILLISITSSVYASNTEVKLKSTSIGIGGGGMLHSPSISNFDDNTVVIASDMGGIYVSNDGGENWSRKNLKGTVFTTYADPCRPGVLYAGGSGLWRSTDNGQNFEMIFPNEDDLIERINYNENSLHYLFTKSKVYPTYKYLKNILVNPNNPDNIYVLCYYGKEGFIYESVDNGKSFIKLFSYKQTKADKNLMYELTKLFYKAETNELYCINDEQVLKFDREKNEAVSVYESEHGIVDAVQVIENNTTQFIIVENINDSSTYDTKVFYTNDFVDKTDLTEKIISGKSNEFDYKDDVVKFKWKFNHIDATSLNNIYLSHSSKEANYPWNITALLRFNGTESIYRYGTPFRNHTNIKNKGWADGNTASYGLAVSKQNPELCVQTTLIGVNFFTNDTDIYQHYSKPIKDENGTRYVTNGIDEQTTYGVRINPFGENHILLLNTDLGLISSTDCGKSWVQANKGINSTWVNTIYDAEFDKNKEGIVYSIWGGRHDAPYSAGNETDNSNVHGGFAISLNGVKNWDCTYSTGIPENTTPVKMAVVYNNSDDVTIYVATFKDGFFVSYDSGKTFNPINDGIEKVSYKDEEGYQYILASDIEAKAGKVFGITARSQFQNSTQKGEVFELVNNKWEKIDLSNTLDGRNVITPRDIYYHDGTLYICSTCKIIYDYKNGRDFSNYGGGIITYKDGVINQIFDESISTTGVQIDSNGNLYVSDLNGNIYKKASNDTEYIKIYDSFHSISKGIQLIDDDTIYLSTLGGGMLKLEGLKSLSNEDTVLGDIDFDNKITINDLAIMKLHLLGKSILKNEKSLCAADMDQDNKITINDLALLKLLLLKNN